MQQMTSFASSFHSMHTRCFDRWPPIEIHSAVLRPCLDREFTRENENYNSLLWRVFESISKGAGRVDHAPQHCLN